jgi:hypothetical protein
MVAVVVLGVADKAAVAAALGIMGVVVLGALVFSVAVAR